jgi:DNA uptake protein ComE-like DNA-binding protein
LNATVAIGPSSSQLKVSNSASARELDGLPGIGWI